MASTAGLNALAHSVTFGVNLAVFTNLAQYMYLHRKRSGTHLEKYGPLYCIIVATVGVMADLVRHLINDANNWYLVDPTGTKLRFDFSDCVYEIPTVGGSDMCMQKSLKGPFLVTEENALGLDISMYNEDGSLSTYGWIFTIMGTWTGFAFLFVGIFWFTDILGKVQRRYAEIAEPRTPLHQAFLTPESRPPPEGFITPFSEAQSPSNT
jgi:hypothetical protein